MSRHRTVIRLSAVLAAAALAKGCGDGDSSTAPPTPEPARPTTVTVSPPTTELAALGATVQLAAEVRDQNSRVMAGATVTWTSNASSVAPVDAAGLVTAADNGAATITASAGSASGSAVVTVTQSVASVAVSPATAALNALGETVQLTAEAFDENGHAVAGTEFSWESSDAAVAAVDDGGLVTGVAKGVATITARAGSAQGTAEIMVGPNQDRAALIALYEATDGPNWVDSENWLTDAPLGDWFGVETNREGQVVGLAMAYWDQQTEEWTNNNVSGPIPPELGNLASLQYVRFFNNRLSGPIPPELGKLSDLRDLDFNSNDLSGPIPPELGNLANLEWLQLTSNALTGPIPLELGNLANLERLYLTSNALTGTIPPELGNLASLQYVRFFNNRLSGPIPPELGKLSDLRDLDFNSNDLSGPIPPELGNLANLERLYLTSNALTGTIPPELGNLANLEWLQLTSNALTGPIPQSFLELGRLRDFRIRRNEGLCVPGTSAFVAWLREIEDWDESEALCNASDVAALKLLYETTGGTAWTESNRWPGDGAVEDWHGVTANSLGRVTILDLARNGLAGELPANLGTLARMIELRIGGNALSGPLPLGLAELSLQTLHYAGTELCAPVEESFRAWLTAIPSHEGTSVECGPLSERYILEALYHSTGGPEWTHNENWLTDAPLGEWYGVEVDDEGGVVELGFLANGLTGPIPRELGGLANLRSLYLFRGGLTGPIPRELGNLANLQTLSLGENDLTGPIPPELGNLADLRNLSLHDNELTGPIPNELANLANLQRLSLTANRLTGRIPAELGELSNLRYLYLGRNELTGPIPTELGGLADLRRLNFAANRLTGRIPAELGGLADLEELYLGENELAGPMPPEFGGLMRLRDLALQTNADLSGALPASLTDLAALETLQTGGTDLCAPSDAGFLEWLEGVANRRVALCEGEPAMAYLVQAVQSREFPVPFVAGEEALLRVFVTAGRDNDERLPPVRASFYLNGAVAHVAEAAGKPGPIPTEVDEGSLATSGNAVVPADVVRPGLEMVVEVDPDGTVDLGLGVARRIPEAGRLAVDVWDMPLFDLTLVPFLWTADPDPAILESASGMAADPEGHELLELTRTLLPVGELKVTAHEPVLSSSNDAYDLIDQTRAIRVMEGGTGYFMGMISSPVTGGVAGLAAGLASFAVPSGGTIGHEFGHNFSLPHAPCGGAGNPDPAYPTPDGTIGAWGYDFEAGRLVPPTSFDIMGYCANDWISDYFFTKALHFRLASEGAPAAAAVAAARSLLLWGGADTDGELYLEPAFVVDAPPALPDSAGEYQLAGRTANGREVFALRFNMPETADGDGSSSFAFALPVRAGWEGSLASITLSGPDGSVTLDGDSDLPMAILRNPGSGQVRGILRDLPPATQAARDAARQAVGPGLEVLFSRGIPEAAAWRR